MPRPRQRVRLEAGSKLDINRLAQLGLIKPGATSGPVCIARSNRYYDREIGLGVITSDLTGPCEGWFCIQKGSLDQKIYLVARPRHFGGRQWFFICPRTARRAMVLWMPPGARSFASRQGWGGQVAYSSQFLTQFDRAHRGELRIKSRLCLLGGFAPEEWDLPPKPKWMRRYTYNRAVEKFDQYEDVLDRRLARAAARLMKRF